MIKDLRERTVAEITYLPAPKTLHAVKVKVFDGYHIVLSEQPASQLEVPVSTLV